MAIAFRAATQAYISADQTPTLTKPTGTVDGDVVVVLILTALSAVTITPPAGFTAIGSQSNIANNATLWVYWHRASGDGPNYTFDLGASMDSADVVASFSGVLASGNPVDVSAGNNNASAPIFSASITTTVANAMRVFCTGNSSAANVDASGNGFTEAEQVNIGFDIGTAIFYQLQAVAGASGTQNFTNGSLGANAWAGFHFALKPETGTPATMPEALLVRRPRAVIDSWRV